jgi:peptidoglycan-associated lipoprotein
MKALTLPCAIVVTAALLCGCAKKPVTAVTSAPPPTGAATASTAGPARDMSSPPAAHPASQERPMGSSTSRPEPSEFVTVKDLPDIHFDFDKYAIRSEDAHVLDGHARWLKANANDLLLIEGHCDERGTIEYNIALGERRAIAAKQYLTAQGISPARITTISYGKEKPQCTDHNEGCWAKNRRAHFLVKQG